MSTATEEDVYLTEEEREALADTSVEAAEKEQAAAAKADGKADEDPETAAAAEANAEAETAVTTTPAPEAVATTTPAPAAAEQSQSAPLLVAHVPEDAEAKLKAIADGKAELLQKFDDGDITAKDYQAGLDKLSKDERAIERQIDKAEIAGDLETQRLKNEWTRDCEAFLGKNPEYAGEDNKERYQHLDETVRAIAVMPRNAGLSGAQILEKAHMMVKAERGETATPAAAADKPATTAAPRPELPPTLAKLPAAAGTETGENKWAALDRLQTSDPLQYEEKLNQMSESDRNAYLASA